MQGCAIQGAQGQQEYAAGTGDERRRAGRGALRRAHLAEAAYAKGNNLIAVGEMGIGNTTAASVMTAALTGMPASLVTGKGTGLDSEAYARKCRIVERL
jgi:NaMN:DMB phosphoribosyltransferase